MTDTSWGKVAGWYDELLGGEGTFQKEVILPHLVRLIGDVQGKKMVDIACGQGFFTEAFAAKGASVLGVDIGEELIAMAKKRTEGNANLEWMVSSATSMSGVPDAKFQLALCVLAIQNIEGVTALFREASRVLAPGGQFHFVLNHPAFRIPKATSWGWDEEKKKQYRRVDAYMSEMKTPIAMHPGKEQSEETVSFHHPISFFIKTLVRAGFVVTGMEEWTSNKVSDSGPRAAEENRTRAEIPMFLYIAATKQ